LVSCKYPSFYMFIVTLHNMKMWHIFVDIVCLM